MAEGRERQPHPISIHALREEGDGFDQQTGKELTQFLSTPSARRATGAVASTTTPKIFLSTPSARRATAVDYEPQQPLGISIHALREEGDASTSRPARS